MRDHAWPIVCFQRALLSPAQSLFLTPRHPPGKAPPPQSSPQPLQVCLAYSIWPVSPTDHPVPYTPCPDRPTSEPLPSHALSCDLVCSLLSLGLTLPGHTTLSTLIKAQHLPVLLFCARLPAQVGKGLGLSSSALGPSA